MGTNYYIDNGEGDHYDEYPHIGKTTWRGYRMFIFYRSREYQLSLLRSMNLNEMVVNEYGERITVHDFIEMIENAPYIEQDFEFS